jgi:predicted nucleotidyltransferase
MFDNPQVFQSVINFLDEHTIPYMVIGGLTMSIWGEGRATHDADFKVIIDTPLGEFRKLILDRFPERPTKIPVHKKSQYILQVWAAPDVATDLLVCIFDYEKEAVRRAVTTEIMGVPTRVCTAEDFIIHKAIANRGKDWLDIPQVLYRQRGKLDLQYIRQWLTQFAEALETPELLTRFEELYETNK